MGFYDRLWQSVLNGNAKKNPSGNLWWCPCGHQRTLANLIITKPGNVGNDYLPLLSLPDVPVVDVVRVGGGECAHQGMD